MSRPMRKGINWATAGAVPCAVSAAPCLGELRAASGGWDARYSSSSMILGCLARILLTTNCSVGYTRAVASHQGRACPAPPVTRWPSSVNDLVTLAC